MLLLLPPPPSTAAATAAAAAAAAAAAGAPAAAAAAAVTPSCHQVRPTRWTLHFILHTSHLLDRTDTPESEAIVC